MNVQISSATDDEVRSGFIGRQLREFNYRFVGEYPEVKTIHLNARDGAGVVVGGLRSLVFLDWLRIEVLWVHDDWRGQGIGSSLLRGAEERAKALGASNALLETFEWQAPAFYEKQGYVEAYRIDGYVGQYFIAGMRKTL